MDPSEETLGVPLANNNIGLIKIKSFGLNDENA
jgi:hypothetical protein